jgi:exonuclease III
VAWNIRAGGGQRVVAISRQMKRWAPDVVALSEFRATAPSLALSAALAQTGLPHQLTTADPTRPLTNALLVAARWPLRRIRLRSAPLERGRWLLAMVDAPAPLVIGVMHVPNRAGGRKYPFLDAVLACARRWRLGPALLVGDTNSGRRGLDEEVAAFNAREEGWIDGLAACRWVDAFRHLQAETRAYTWYSPNGRNGFRIDQAFVNARLLPRLAGVRYVWAGQARRGRRDALSDHAALLVDLTFPRRSEARPAPRSLFAQRRSWLQTSSAVRAYSRAPVTRASIFMPKLPPPTLMPGP